jgi:hypothetical protein
MVTRIVNGLLRWQWALLMAKRAVHASILEGHPR